MKLPRPSIVPEPMKEKGPKIVPEAKIFCFFPPQRRRKRDGPEWIIYCGLRGINFGAEKSTKEKEKRAEEKLSDAVKSREEFDHCLLEDAHAGGCVCYISARRMAWPCWGPKRPGKRPNTQSKLLSTGSYSPTHVLFSQSAFAVQRRERKKSKNHPQCCVVLHYTRRNVLRKMEQGE